MSRRTTEFQTIRSEGGLLPPDLLRRVVDPTGKVSGVEPSTYGLPEGERLTEAITQSWTRLRRHWADFRAAVPKPSASNASPHLAAPKQRDGGSPLTESEAFTGITNDKWSLPLLRELGFGFLATSAAPTIDGKTYAISRFAGHTALHLVGCGVSLDRRAAGVRGAAQSNPHGLVQEFLNRSTAHLWAIVSNGLSLRILRDNQALSRQSFLEFDLEAMFDGEVYSDFVLLWLIAHATRFLPRNDGRPDSCWLETWSKEAAEQGVAALTDLRGGVEKALQILGQGFVSHPKNTALREALRKGELKLSDFHGQLLRIVYRLIFLFVAEDRDLEGIPLLHPQDKSDAARLARERYTAHYSTTRLRELASRIKGSRHGDLWRQFQLIVGALSGDDRFAALRAALALPPLGSMLWNPASTALLNGPGLAVPQPSTLNPHLPSDGTELSNVDFLEALRHLAFIRKDKILRPVDYKNLGSPEFGGVYESFLALTPQISGDGARFTFAEFAGNERKTSGSYYTPDSLVQPLLDSALDPVVQERLADAERLAKSDWGAVEKEIQSDPVKRNYVLAFLTKRAGAARGATGDELKRAWDSIPPALRHWQLSEEAILAIKVCDKACGSGHFLVGTAHRLARHLARVRALAAGESEPSPLLYQTALRDVIGHCLYGVDINPMAVELCKVTLWLEALEPGKPLSFLDHHIRCGNSLLGATPELIRGGIPDEAYESIEGDDKEACSALKKQNKRENPKLGEWFIADEAAIRDKLFHAAAAIDEMGDSRPEDIRRKEAAFRAAQANYDFDKAWALANLWCAAFVIKKRFPESAVPLAIDDRQSAITETPGEAAKPLPAWFGVSDQDKKPKAKGRKPSTLNYPPSTPPIGITTQHLRDFVEGGALPDGLLAEAKRLADQYQFFHWYLAFPEVFQLGGFDLLIGNPPWDMVELSEKEFFASRDPNIAEAPTARQRQESIKSLLTSNPQLFRLFSDSKRQVYGIRHFVQHSGHFPYSSTGRINMYPLFVERAASLTAPRGRSGIVVPSAISMDAYNAALFSWLIEGKRLVSLYDFDNTFGLFPEVHSRFRFCLLTTTGASTGLNDFAFCFYAHDASELRIPERLVRLTLDQILSFSPNTLAPPMFMNAMDAALAKLAYGRCGVLANHRTKQNLWQISIQRMLSLSDPGDIFRRSTELEDGEESASPALWTRLHSGKAIHQYEHRFATFEGKDWRVVEAAEQKQSDFVIRTEYYARSGEVASRLADKSPNNWLLVYRDVTNATNERTSIAAIIPQSGCDTTCRNLFSHAEPRNLAAFLGCLNSLCFDYFVRQKVIGMHLGAGVFEQLPALPPQLYGLPPSWTQIEKKIRDWLLPRVLELTYTAWDLEAFAHDCGWSGPPFHWDEGRRFLLRCELDAAFFHLYLGSEDEWRKQPEALTKPFPTPRDAVSYIMDTFPIVKRKDEAKFNGDYRTKRSILEIYDALAESMKSGKAYQTRLNPPAANIAVAHLPRFDRERVNFQAAGDYILPFVGSLLRHQGGECDVMTLIRAYALLLGDRKTLSTLSEARFGAEAGAWVKRFNQPVDASWFLPILRGLDNRDVLKLEERGKDDVFIRLLDANVPSNPTVETDVYLLMHVLDLNATPPTAVAEQVKRISPKAVRISLQEAKLITA